MNVAICLFGQPRFFEECSKNILKIVENNPSCVFDFYCHTWWSENMIGQKYSGQRQSRWRRDCIKKETPTKLMELYNPKKIKIEEPIDFSQHKVFKQLVQTTEYKKMGRYRKQDIPPTLSQLYSRNSVLNLLIKSEIKYDYVVLVRYDYDGHDEQQFGEIVNWNFNKLQKKLYVVDDNPAFKSPYFGDMIFVMNYEQINFINVFDNILDLMSNDKLKEFIRNEYNIHSSLCVHYLYLLNYINIFKNLKNVVFCKNK
jgi:hypothetical protein